MVEEIKLGIEYFIYLVFLQDGKGICEEVFLFFDNFCWSIDMLFLEFEKWMNFGICMYDFFLVVNEELKDEIGSYLYVDENFYFYVICIFKECFFEVVLMLDVVLDFYFFYGYDGIYWEGKIFNDEILLYLGKMVLVQVQVGIDIIGFFDMMDGCVGYICDVFDGGGFIDVFIMFYIVKYVSVFYGFFCDVLNLVLKFGDKKIYQMNLVNKCEVLIEVELDVVEGVDFLMVKLVLVYFDIIYFLKENFV